MIAWFTFTMALTSLILRAYYLVIIKTKDFQYNLHFFLIIRL